MRKFILITAMVLVSAAAQAETTRSLTLASNDDPAAAEPPKTVDAPKYVDRPAAVDTKIQQPKVEMAPPAAAPKVEAPKAEIYRVEKPRRHYESTEARVIYELHRHGVYW